MRLLSTKTSEAATVGAKSAELEEAQTQALARQQSTDSTIQNLEARIAEYEKEASKFSIVKERQQAKVCVTRLLAIPFSDLILQVHELELHIAVATRDKAAAEQTTAAIREERDRLLSRQDHWEEMHRAAEQIHLLTSQVNKADNEELRHLRDYHDRTRSLEGEYNSLQRRFEDQETKLATLDRTIAAVRKTLARAQQQAVEWEKRAKETDSEVSLLMVQLQEKEVDECLTQVSCNFHEQQDEKLMILQDRESKLRDQVASFEEQISRLKAEASKPAVVAPVAITATNGYKFEPPDRAESRASAAYLHSRPATPVNTKPARAQLTANGIWNSMHNPYRADGVPHRMQNGNGLSASKPNGASIRPPSPAASVVSTDPTVDEDGWWS